MMSNVTKFTIRKPDGKGGYEKYYELFDAERQFIIRLDKDNEILKMFPVDKGYFDKYPSCDSVKMTVKKSLLEKAHKTMSVYIEQQRHFRLLQDMTKDEMLNSMKHFISLGIKEYDQGKFSEAIHTFKFACEYENDYSAYLWISRCYIKNKMVDKAIDYLDDAYRYGFYVYDDIIEDKDFESILNDPKVIEVIKKMFMKRPGKIMSIRTMKYLHKHGIFSLDDDDEPSGKRYKVDEVASIHNKISEIKNQAILPTPPKPVQATVSSAPKPVQATVSPAPKPVQLPSSTNITILPAQNTNVQVKSVPEPKTTITSQSTVVVKPPMAPSNQDKILIPKEQLYFVDTVPYGIPIHNNYQYHEYSYGYPVGNQYGYSSQRYFDDRQRRPEFNGKEAAIRLIKSAMETGSSKNIIL